MSTSEVLDAKIRALVIELIESAPPAPTPAAIESEQWGPHPSKMRPGTDTTARHLRFSRRWCGDRAVLVALLASVSRSTPTRGRSGAASLDRRQCGQSGGPATPTGAMAQDADGRIVVDGSGVSRSGWGHSRLGCRGNGSGDHDPVVE